MRYVRARIDEEERAETYRFYITDALKAIGNLNLRYYDIVTPIPEETRTAEEIIQSISDKLARVGGE